jgi:FAD/FMN-containing dehydrogenase
VTRDVVEPGLPRRALLGWGVAAGATLACGGNAAMAQATIVLNDASRLNPTPVARHIVVTPDAEAVLLARLRAELRDARAAGRPVAMGAARHSMGGQSLARAGTALSFAESGCEVDRAAGTCRAGMGTRWRNVIATLDPLGLSPMVMQSNHDFGVASTFSVNAHGWPVPHGPFGTTVHRMRLMLADGSLVTCSPRENAALFGLAMGGYGLAGIIVDIDTSVTPNRLLAPSFALMPADAFGTRFAALCTDPSVCMAYGRLDVSSHDFLGEALMVGYRMAADQPAVLPRAGEGGGAMGALSREVYRAQTGSEFGKRARWFVESEIAPGRLERRATRNALLNEPVANLAGSDTRRTDILHEYFVAPARFADFLTACREVIPRFHQDLLNVTLRFVEADTVSVLAYAPARRIAAVMSFTQTMDGAAEADMRAMTRALVERVIAIGGSFYLPYRLHATAAQMHRAYPRAREFAACKRRYDPGLLFRNALWDTWLSADAGRGAL